MMMQPYIDGARRLSRRDINPDEVTRILCKTAEGIVARLWDPLAVKRSPPNAYAAKFSMPFCIAYALRKGAVGLEAFTEENARDPATRALAGKVSYEIDPD